VSTEQKRRAKPLPPDERRRAIVDAITPLLVDKGSAVSSRQMAEAAGVAEGTIFGVFPDKRSVIRAALRTAMDPAPICEALAAIPERVPIDSQLESAASILLERSERVAALIGVLRALRVSPAKRPAGIPKFVGDSNAAILAGLTRLLARHAAGLRVEPERAAIAFRGLIFANAHPIVTGAEKIPPSEIVDLLLRGVGAGPESN